MTKDKIYNTPHDTLGRFQFDERVVNVFSDMIERSVPGYRLMLDMIAVISQHYTQPNTHCYDLGCSLGASTASILSSANPNVLGVHGIDNSAAMVEKCQTLLAEFEQSSPSHTRKIPAFDIQCADILDTQFLPSSLVTLNFTLQFIAQEKRKKLLGDIQSAMVEGGALVLSEKIVLEPSESDQRLFDLHHDFKRAKGYSDLEIAQKRAALEDVLVPETIDTHLQRLRDAGFSSADVWFQCFNFVSILAVK